MSYETAPATQLVATNCAFCARPLLDAQSVTVGVGPVCRKKHMVADQLSDEVRKEANRLIYQIAVWQRGELASAALKRLRALGCEKAAKRIQRRLGAPVLISYDGDTMILKTPFLTDRNQFDAWIDTMRAIPGRKFDRESKVETFPCTREAKQAVWEALKRFFAGRVGEGPQGDFLIG